MTKNKNIALIILLLFTYSIAQAAVPERVGWWKFDDPTNQTKAENGYGLALSLVGKPTVADGPAQGNGAVMLGVGSYYKMKHAMLPNGGGKYVNEYTLQFDFKVPQNDVWHCFFQTSPNNGNDGDFFINPSGNIGVAAVGYSGNAIEPNEWYRLIVSVKNGSEFKCYLDGNLLLTGTTQTKDGRFALDSLLLIFADEDGEDGNIYCAELAIWNQTLNAEQIKELGGYGHDFTPFMMTRIPYLQSQGTNTMTICWHDTAQTGTKVEYGTDQSLALMNQGTSELINVPYRWHTVKLIGLQANTRYFYRITSGNGESEIYTFKTLPDASYTGKLRFVILSDTHASDTTMAAKILRATRSKIVELYGADIENYVNGVLHSGDIVVSGNSPELYSKQYFYPMSALSPNIPSVVVAGNHEGESAYFYKYLKLDDFSAFPQNMALNEKIWQLRVGNSLFIGMNTNIIGQYGAVEANWLDAKLKEAENDASIDFVYLFFHHPPFSELWFVVNTFDGGSNYVKNTLFPIIKKYTKVQQLHTGHTHGFERGTIKSDKVDGDFRIVCGGGSGGPLDPWKTGENFDYEDIHITLSQYCFQILEIDIANHSFQNTMYSLGDLTNPRKSDVMDFWYKKKNQPQPDAPVVENSAITDESIQFNLSAFSGVDSIMSAQYQIIDSLRFSIEVLDSVIHWENIYGIDNKNNPVDLNRNIDFYRFTISPEQLYGSKSGYFRARYRDHNLKWSNWSNPFSFKTVGINAGFKLPDNQNLYQNYPNPFQNKTVIAYQINETSQVSFRIYDMNYRLIAQINEGVKTGGKYQLDYNAENLNSGVYFYQMITKDACITKRMNKME